MPLTGTMLRADRSIAKSRDLLTRIAAGLRESARTVAYSRSQINESLAVLHRTDVSLAEFVGRPSLSDEKP